MSPPATNGSLAMALFFVVLLLPISFDLAGLRLSPLRLFMLLGALPLMIAVLQGRAGRLIITDALVIGYAAWIVLSLAANHGAARIPLGVANASETVSAYFLGRILVRRSEDFRRIFRFGLISLIFLFPFALYELFTGTIVIAKLFDPIFDVIFRGKSAHGRMGLERVYAVFGHPILFGLYCAVMVANFVVIFEGAIYQRILAVSLAVAMTFMALSSAPLLAVVLQIMMLLWWRLTKGAWWALAVLTVCAYVIVDLISNRSPLEVLFAYATFNPRSGWMRMAIFEYGSRAALNNPVFGIGINPFPRPNWVPDSVDNFWLLVAMRHGLPALLILVAGIFAHFIAILRAQLPDPVLMRYRVGYLVSLVAVLFTLTTVHVWDAAYAFIIFLIGAGAWFYTSDHASSEADTPPPPNGRPLRYTRFSDSPRSATPGKPDYRRAGARQTQ